MLIGNATTSSPYSIISGGSYSLSSGQSQTITVRFSPTSAGAFTGNVIFTGADEASRSVTGIGLPPATLVTTPNSVPPGGTITAVWNGIAAPTVKDWIGLYVPGSPQGSSFPSLAWRYTTGSASGNVPLVIPGALAPGTYELRLFSNDGYTRLATSNTITVTAAPTATISATPTAIAAGGTITAVWNGIAAPTIKDWIGLYMPGSPRLVFPLPRLEVYNRQRQWQCTLASVPGALAPGTYELRLFSNDGYTRLATSNTITVTAAPTATISATPTAIAAGGTITAVWNGIAAPTIKDWIGLYMPGSSQGSSFPSPRLEVYNRQRQWQCTLSHTWCVGPRDL